MPSRGNLRPCRRITTSALWPRNVAAGIVWFGALVLVVPALVQAKGRATLQGRVTDALDPSQIGFSTTPLRAIGAVAINIGTREAASAFQIDGVTANNLTFGPPAFEPRIASLHEFKVDISRFSVDYGDIEFNSSRPHPFRKTHFGRSLGDPIVRELRRWGISEKSPPPHTLLLFGETSVWERYKTLIALTVSMLVLQLLLIVGLIFERRRRRRAEMESRRNLAAMAHLDRRAAMGELATSLAHELNQPLNAILQNAGVAQLLLKSNGLPSAGEMSEIISDIRKDDLRASEVIRRMRRLLQKHELESHPVNLNEVVQDTVAIVWPDARSRGIQLEVETAESLPPVLGDHVHLQQVMLNLLMNALDAVAMMPAERRRVRVWTTQLNGEARTAVSDSGPGISTDPLSRIFEPFYTTKNEGTGMGLGLAIARSIVEAHAGHLAAENNAGGGATVWFSIPTSASP